MISMPMGRNEVIDLVDARDSYRHIVDAGGVAIQIPSCVHEDGFTSRSNHERRSSSFHINPVDVER